MRASRLLLLTALFSMFVLLAASCSGSKDDVPDFPTVVTLGEGDIFPSILNSSLAIGDNRVIWQLIDADDNPVFDAAINYRYFNLNGNEPVFSSDAESLFVASETNFIDENNERERTVTGETGVYITNTNFDVAGEWGAELTIFQGEKQTVTTYRFTVREHSLEPGIGDPAPASEQATTATEPLEEIDSSYPPREAMHTTTVAAALKTGKPVVVAFATPAFCTSRTCGPVMDLVVDPLSWRYADDAIFIHIEPYLLRDARQANVRNPVPATLEWRLESEPWVFVIGRDGKVAGKFEGVVAMDEVESVLQLSIAAGEPSSATPAHTP